MKLKAFTLVELMVVMAIIAFLSVGAYGGLTYALRQGRDTQRIRIADQVQTAMQAYYADYQGYLGCTGGTTVTVPGFVPATGLMFCPGAFGATSSFVTTASPNGLKDYFESEFKWGPINNATNVDNEIRYYFQPTVTGVKTKANKFTVCVSLENTKGAAASVTKGNVARGCYCVGANQSDIACFGMN
jgi:prepilin-type N-terminal cleavage/methylation domain-containing protein